MSDVGRTERVPVVPGIAAPSELEAEKIARHEAKTLPLRGKKLPETEPTEIKARVDAHDQNTLERVEKAIATLNEYSRSTQRDLEFSIDGDLDRTIVQVVDRSTQEVVRQIPNEVALNLARNLQANLEQLSLQRAARLAGVDQFASEQAVSGIVNTLA